MTLENLRKEVDLINHKIIVLLAKRLELTRSIATLKKEQALPIDDPVREKKQYQDLSELAKKYHLQPWLIEKIFSLVIDYSKNRMEEIE